MKEGTFSGLMIGLMAALGAVFGYPSLAGLRPTALGTGEMIFCAIVVVFTVLAFMVSAVNRTSLREGMAGVAIVIATVVIALTGVFGPFGHPDTLDDASIGHHTLVSATGDDVTTI